MYDSTGKAGILHMQYLGIESISGGYPKFLPQTAPYFWDLRQHG